MGTSSNLLTDFEQRNTPPRCVATLPTTPSAFSRSIGLASCQMEAYCYKVLMDTYILKFIHYLFLKSSVHIAQYVILILLIFYVLRLLECFREKHDPGKCVIRTTLTHWVVFGTEISCCSLSFGWFPDVWILHRPRRWNRHCFEKSAHKIQTPGNHPKERLQHSEHGEILKLWQLPDIWLISGFLKGEKFSSFWKWAYCTIIAWLHAEDTKILF
jgi:hypothetical protein